MPGEAEQVMETECGQIVAPHAAERGYTTEHQADATYLDDALGDVKATLAELQAADDAAVLAPDPRLAFVRGSVRPTLQPVLDRLDAALKAHLADPNRKFLNEAGRADADARFGAQRDAALAAVEQKLAAQLDALEAEAAAAVQAVSGVPVEARHDETALRLSTMLSRTSVAHGLPVLASFIGDAADDRGLAYAALPLLRSLYDGMDGAQQWAKNDELLRVTHALQAIVEAAPGHAPARAKLARVQRSKWELGELLKSARGDGQAARFVDRDGRLVLFPDAPAPPPPEPTPRGADGRYTGRRLNSAARRAADEERRRAMREAEE